MKKIRKADLKLEKEVITALSANDLTGIKGGAQVTAVDCKTGFNNEGTRCNCPTFDYNCWTNGANCNVIMVSFKGHECLNQKYTDNKCAETEALRCFVGKNG